MSFPLASHPPLFPVDFARVTGVFSKLFGAFKFSNASGWIRCQGGVTRNALSSQEPPEMPSPFLLWWDHGPAQTHIVLFQILIHELLSMAWASMSQTHTWAVEGPFEDPGPVLYFHLH